MKYDYTVYTPGGAVCFAAASHSADLQGKLTCTDKDYTIVAEFPVWHGLTRSRQPEAVANAALPPEVKPAPAVGDFSAGPIVFPELPEDDDIPF